MDQDQFKTIKEPSSIETKIKGSKFIAHSFVIESEKQANEVISATRKKYFNATHNCFAYHVGFGGDEISRFSDDGEPAGTAGKPILTAITSQELTNVCVIVTRYFGGIKLGTGGLTRAYGGCAKEALLKSGEKVQVAAEKFILEYPYELSSVVAKTFSQFDVQIDSSEYSEIIKQKVLVRKSQIAHFVLYLTDISSGQIKIKT